MSGKRENLHIAILKFGRDKYEVGVKFSDLTSHLEKLKYKVSRHRLEYYFFETYEAINPRKRGNSGTMAAEDVPCDLSIK